VKISHVKSPPKENKKKGQKKPFKIVKFPYERDEEKEIHLSKLEEKEIRKSIEKERITERENMKRLIQRDGIERINGKESYEEIHRESYNRRGDRSSDDELEKLFECQIKKKTKLEKKEDSEEIIEIEITGPGSKSTSSEPEHRTSEEFNYKKGMLAANEKYETLPYTEEFPRRSLREKREPKGYDKKLYR